MATVEASKHNIKQTYPSEKIPCSRNSLEDDVSSDNSYSSHETEDETMDSEDKLRFSPPHKHASSLHRPETEKEKNNRNPNLDTLETNATDYDTSTESTCTVTHVHRKKRRVTEDQACSVDEIDITDDPKEYAKKLQSPKDMQLGDSSELIDTQNNSMQCTLSSTLLSPSKKPVADGSIETYKWPVSCVICNIFRNGSVSNRFSIFNQCYNDGEVNRALGTRQWLLNMIVGILQDLQKGNIEYTTVLENGAPSDVLWPQKQSIRKALELHFLGTTSDGTSTASGICGEQTEFFNRHVTERLAASLPSTNLKALPATQILQLLRELKPQKKSGATRKNEIR